MGDKKSTQIFSKKIKDLATDTLAETDDFFANAFKAPNSVSSSLVSSSANSKPKSSAKNSTAASHANSANARLSTDPENAEMQWWKNLESYDGQLAVDVFQTPTHLVITAALAGVLAGDIDVSLNGDMITIKGQRQHLCQEVPDGDYFIRECYWGGFSRSIILPVDIQHENVDAKFENGILTITIPKAKRSRNAKIEVVDVSA